VAYWVHIKGKVVEEIMRECSGRGDTNMIGMLGNDGEEDSSMARCVVWGGDLVGEDVYKSI
jgi:hypothetical protein